MPLGILHCRLLCRIGNDLNSSKLGFVRNLAGQAEKWLILKADTANSNASLGISSNNNGKTSSSSGRRVTGCEEEPNSYGTFVRIGDHILLQPVLSSNDHLISLYESSEGREIRIQHKDKVYLYNC